MRTDFISSCVLLSQPPHMVEESTLLEMPHIPHVTHMLPLMVNGHQHIYLARVLTGEYTTGQYNFLLYHHQRIPKIIRLFYTTLLWIMLKVLAYLSSFTILRPTLSTI